MARLNIAAGRLRGVRLLVAIVLCAHGIAHFSGFVFSWRVGMLAALPYETTILAGRVDLGQTASRAIGLLWLLVGLGFLVTAFRLAIQKPPAFPVMTLMVVVSLVLCVASWPESSIGAGVDLALATVLLLNARWPRQPQPA